MVGLAVTGFWVGDGLGLNDGEEVVGLSVTGFGVGLNVGSGVGCLDGSFVGFSEAMHLVRALLALLVQTWASWKAMYLVLVWAASVEWRLAQHQKERTSNSRN